MYFDQSSGSYTFSEEEKLQCVKQQDSVFNQMQRELLSETMTDNICVVLEHLRQYPGTALYIIQQLSLINQDRSQDTLQAQPFRDFKCRIAPAGGNPLLRVKYFELMRSIGNCMRVCGSKGHMILELNLKSFGPPPSLAQFDEMHAMMASLLKVAERELQPRVSQVKAPYNPDFPEHRVEVIVKPKKVKKSRRQDPTKITHSKVKRHRYHQSPKHHALLMFEQHKRRKVKATVPSRSHSQQLTVSYHS